MAHKSIVLLKNDPPEGVSQHVPSIERSQVKHLVVVGTLAAFPSPDVHNQLASIYLKARLVLPSGR